MLPLLSVGMERHDPQRGPTSPERFPRDPVFLGECEQLRRRPWSVLGHGRKPFLRLV